MSQPTQHPITANAWVETDSVQGSRELTILQSTIMAITASLDLRYVLNTVAQEMTGLFEVESCAIFEWHQGDGVVALAARYDPDGWWDAQSPGIERRLADYPLTQWVLDEQIPSQMVVSQPTIDPAELAYMSALNLKTRLLVPMVFQERVLGLVELEESRVERNFSYQDIALAKVLANQAASAIQNARLFEQAQQEISERKRAEVSLAEERALLAQRVTERTAELSRANAELARAARLKDEFLASMSHELRTPLNGILGSAEILQTGVFGPINDKQIQYLHNVEESGRHLLSLITDILDLAKSEAGKLEVSIGPVSVETVCQASLRLTKELAYKKQLKVSYKPAKNVTAISADERRLKQILVNLLSNAIKFTPAGGQVGLDVTGDAVQQVIHFTVWDTGIGIAPEDMQWLFRPFVQLDSSLGRQYGGTGLGLSLVSRMVELHGGGVTVESAPGLGSRFTVSLPWSQTDQAASTVQIEPAGVSKAEILPSHPHGAPLILLAEDNEHTITTFSDYLQHQGYRVVVARNGAEAIDRVREENPAIILMDVQMPGMDGLTATRRLRAEGVTIPIITLTALAMPGDRERCLAAGANDYLSKPVSLRELVKLIETHLRGGLSGQ